MPDLFTLNAIKLSYTIVCSAFSPTVWTKFQVQFEFNSYVCYLEHKEQAALFIWMIFSDVSIVCRVCMTCLTFFIFTT